MKETDSQAGIACPSGAIHSLAGPHPTALSWRHVPHHRCRCDWRADRSATVPHVPARCRVLQGWQVMISTYIVLIFAGIALVRVLQTAPINPVLLVVSALKQFMLMLTGSVTDTL